MSYVWYACYGSNINEERFMLYINKCVDKTPPLFSKTYKIPYHMYFGNRKSRTRWGDGAVAYLDDSKTGNVLGKVYLITEEQFKDVQSQEKGYNKPLSLGMLDGYPVYSFTSLCLYKRDIPTIKYVSTILDGLKSTYPEIDEVLLKSYLIQCIFTENELSVIETIRTNPCRIKIGEIANKLEMSLSDVVRIVLHLKEIGLIQKDRRSNDRDDADVLSEYFTVETHQANVTKMLNILKGAKELNEFCIDDVEPIIQGYEEGEEIQSFITHYERNPRNRMNAIHLHGTTCMVCGFNFEEVYGEIGKNYIEVHHVNPLSTLDESTIIHPETDLVCVCSNCHRMLHRNRDRVLTIEELKEMMNRNR